MALKGSKETNKRHNDRDVIQRMGEREKITDPHLKGVTEENTKKKQAAKQPNRIFCSRTAC